MSFETIVLLSIVAIASLVAIALVVRWFLESRRREDQNKERQNTKDLLHAQEKDLLQNVKDLLHARGEKEGQQLISSVKDILHGQDKENMSSLSKQDLAWQKSLEGAVQEIKSQVGERLQSATEKIGRQVGERLQSATEKNEEVLGKLQERLAVIGKAQDRIVSLSDEVGSLQKMLVNKQARGLFGETQLRDLIRQALPSKVCRFQVTLSNGKRCDCLIDLPRPPGPLVVDAKFPLESYRDLIAADDEQKKSVARKNFGEDVRRHVKDIAQKYILPGETAEWALMFLPSEVIFADVHNYLPQVVDEAHKLHVGIVSPATMMALLTTIRSILRDVRMREQAATIQKEVGNLQEDLQRLSQRLKNLDKHFSSAQKDLKEARTSWGKIANRRERILSLEPPQEQNIQPSFDFAGEQTPDSGGEVFISPEHALPDA